MIPPNGIHRKTISAILVEAGVVDDAQVQAGLIRQRETGRRIGATLVELGFVSEEDIGWALARQLAIPFVDVRPEALDADLVRSFPEAALRRLQAVPFVQGDGLLTAAFADPTDHDAREELARLCATQVECVAATSSAIERALDTLFGHRAPRRAAAPEAPEGTRFDVVWEPSGESFLNFHLVRALRSGATEIHFVASGGFLDVFHRVSGRLAPVARESAAIVDVLLARLEGLGAPPAPAHEDHVAGSIIVVLAGTLVSLHVSMLATRDGLSVTLRLLRDAAEQPALESLGLESTDRAELRAVADEPPGLVIVTGPAGSGRTTTLAALLAAFAGEDRRWLVFARDARLWSVVPEHVDVIGGGAAGEWRSVAAAHGLDGLVLDGGLAGPRLRTVTGSATQGRWVLAHTDWEDSFAMLETLARGAAGRASVSRRLRAVIQQRLIAGAIPAAAPGPGAAAGVAVQHAVFEVLVPSPAFRAALLAGARAAELRAIAADESFTFLADRIHAAALSGRVDARDAARAAA